MRTCGTAAGHPVAAHAEQVAAVVAAMPVERLGLLDAVGRVLAGPVVCATGWPSFDSSAMDGYAVRAADLRDAQHGVVELPVSAHVPAGRLDVPTLSPGHTHRIMTGARLPAGADAVVPIEEVESGVGIARFRGPSAAGRNVRWRGEDIAAGEVVLEPGTVLGPTQLAAAAASGADTLPVRRAVRVAVVSAGSELVAPGVPSRVGRIHDTNGPLLVAALRAAGAEAWQVPVVPDRAPALVAALAEHTAGADVVVTSGGISVGDHEVVRDVLAPLGIEFRHVAMKPGGPQGVGFMAGRAVVALPGNPVACWVSFEVFVRPALRAAMGLPAQRPRVPLPVTAPLRARPGRREYVPAVVVDSGGAVAAAPRGSHSYRALATADCLIELVEDDEHVPAGHVVSVLLTSSLPA